MRLAFTGDRNRQGRKDWSGAFWPEAKRFTPDVVQVPLRGERHMPEQRTQIVDAIRAVRPTVVAFFCHGLTRGIELGFRRPQAGELAAVLAEVGCDRVALYCCSTGGGPGIGGDGGFADCLRDAMCRAGLVDCRVVAHVTAGHATMNPRKRFFEGLGSPVGGIGGMDVVRPRSALWSRWCRRLRDTDDPLRFQLVEMTVGEIHRALV